MVFSKNKIFGVFGVYDAQKTVEFWFMKMIHNFLSEEG